MWLGLSVSERNIVADTKSGKETTVPSIGLGSFLLLIHQGNIVIIDVRPPEEHMRTRIRDALNMQQLGSPDADKTHFESLKKARNIVLYSSSGVTDQMRDYAQILSKRGIEGVAFYSGGFREWLGAGLPVVRGTPTATD